MECPHFFKTDKIINKLVQIIKLLKNIKNISEVEEELLHFYDKLNDFIIFLQQLNYN